MNWGRNEDKEKCGVTNSQIFGVVDNFERKEKSERTKSWDGWDGRRATFGTIHHCPLPPSLSFPLLAPAVFLNRNRRKRNNKNKQNNRFPSSLSLVYPRSSRRNSRQVRQDIKTGPHSKAQGGLLPPSLFSENSNDATRVRGGATGGKGKPPSHRPLLLPSVGLSPVTLGLVPTYASPRRTKPGNGMQWYRLLDHHFLL